MMTPAMWASLARIIIQWVCTYLVARGVISMEQAQYLSDPAMLATVAAAIAAIGTAVYGVYQRRPAALVKEVSKLPEVSYVAATPELKAQVPNAPKVEIDPVRAANPYPPADESHIDPLYR